jgi:thiol-disulfide isomerase/thioredoxin
VVFLNFWATWCTACEAEMPDMERLARQHPDDLVVLAVNRGESKGAAKKWSDARKLDSIFFVVDPRESISGTYKLPNSMPVSFFIDAQGNVTRVVPAAQSYAMMEQAYKEAKAFSGTGIVRGE